MQRFTFYALLFGFILSANSLFSQQKRFDKFSRTEFIQSTTSLPPEVVSIKSESDILYKRDSLIKYIFGEAGWPSTRVPDQIDKDVDILIDSSNVKLWQYDNNKLSRSSYNLATIDRYRVQSSNGPLGYKTYLFHPIVSNNKLFIYHGGHGYGFNYDDWDNNNNKMRPGLVIPALLKKGYTVLGISMPLEGDDVPPTIPFTAAHDQMFQYLDHPYQYFFYDLIVSLNYIRDTYNFSEYNMMGLSGGGWSTAVYAALDEKIRFSFPFAGGIPLYLRIGYEGLGDAEQGYDYNGLYGIANYTELFIMGSYGDSRAQMQTTNRYDACCFYGNTRYLKWIDSVKLHLDALGKGTYNFFLDESFKNAHKISPEGLQEMFNFLCYYGDSTKSMVLPVINNNADDVVTICKNSPYTFYATPNNPSLKYQWQVNFNKGAGFQNIKEGSVCIGSNTPLLYVMKNNSVLNNAFIRFVVSGDCYPTTYSIPVKIYISDDQFSPVSFYSSSGCVPVSFVDSTKTVQGDSIVRWRWNFGDGKNSYQRSPTDRYDSGGIYPVTLYVEHTSGCRNSITDSVKIFPVPKSNFTYSGGGCSNEASFVNLSASAKGDSIVAWHWNFGDNSISSVKDPMHLYSLDGTYTTTLTVTSSSGCIDTTSVKVKIVVPQSNFIYSGGGCFSEVTFVDLSTAALDDSIVAWHWNFGDNSISSVKDPMHLYTLDGTYTTTLTITSSSGCTDTVSVKVRIFVPQSNFTYSGGGCSNEVAFVDLSTAALGDSIVAWHWNLGDNSVSSTANPMHQYNTFGAYNATLTVTSLLGCSDTTSFKVKVFALPTTSYDLPTYCHPDSLCFKDNSFISEGNIVSWNWDFGDGTTSAYQNPTHHYDLPGTYTTSLIVASNFGCKDTTKSEPIDILTASDLKVFPNPNSGRFSLELNGEMSYGYLQVYNSFGQIVHSEQVDSSLKKEIQLENLSIGVYHLRINTNDKQWATRILKTD